MELFDDGVDILSLDILAGDEMLLLFRKGEAEPRAEELKDWEVGISFIFRFFG